MCSIVTLQLRDLCDAMCRQEISFNDIGYECPGNTHQQLSDAVTEMASAKGQCADVVAAAFVESFNNS